MDAPIYLGPPQRIGGPKAWLLDLVFEDTPTAELRGAMAVPLAKLMRKADFDPWPLPTHVYASDRCIVIALHDCTRRGKNASLDDVVAFVREVDGVHALEHAAIWAPRKPTDAITEGDPPGPYPAWHFDLDSRPVDDALPPIEPCTAMQAMRRKRWESLAEQESHALHERLQQAYDKAASRNRISFEPIPLERARLRPMGSKANGPEADVLPTDARFAVGSRIFCRDYPKKLWYVADDGSAREVRGGGALVAITVTPDGQTGYAKAKGQLHRIDFASGETELVWKTGTNITDLKPGPEPDLLWVASSGRVEMVNVSDSTVVGAVESEGKDQLFSTGDVCLIGGEAGKSGKPRTWVYAWRDGRIREVDWIDCKIQMMFCWQDGADLYGEAWRHTGGSPHRVGGIAKSYGVLRDLAAQVARVFDKPARKKR